MFSGALIIVNKLIAVKAVPTDNSPPWKTKDANEMTLTAMGALVHNVMKKSIFALDFLIHPSSFSRAWFTRSIHFDSQAKNLMNLTAPMSSFKTPIRLSRAVERPLWIRNERRAKRLFRGHTTRITKNPAKAAIPRSLKFRVEELNLARTRWKTYW